MSHRTKRARRGRRRAGSVATARAAAVAPPQICRPRGHAHLSSHLSCPTPGARGPARCRPIGGSDLIRGSRLLRTPSVTVTTLLRPGDATGTPVVWKAFRIDAAVTRHSEDARLVAAIASRDQGSLAEAYRAHADLAFGLARRILTDRTLAEEVVQEVFLRLWNAPEKYDAGRGSLRSFVMTQVHGRSVDLLRSEQSRRHREEREAWAAPSSTEDLERAVLGMAEAEVVRRALGGLSEQERSAIELAYFGGHTYREVAVLLEQPEGTVKSRIRTGLLRLRAALIEAGIDQS